MCTWCTHAVYLWFVYVAWGRGPAIESPLSEGNGFGTCLPSSLCLPLGLLSLCPVLAWDLAPQPRPGHTGDDLMTEGRGVQGCLDPGLKLERQGSGLGAQKKPGQEAWVRESA